MDSAFSTDFTTTEARLPVIRNAVGDSSARRDNEWVALQFDDRVFTLSRSTLQGEPDSLFARLFSDDAVSASTLDRNHSHPLRPVVFDRSPRYVEPLLQYLRTGELMVGDKVDLAFLRGVYVEAEYFGVSGLVEFIQQHFPDATKSFVQRRRDEQEAAATARKPNTANREDIERMLMNAPFIAVDRDGECGAAQPRLRWRGMRFNGVDFSGLYLAGIDFTGSEMNDCDFSRCDLTAAILTDAELENANFTSAVLKRARCDRVLAPGANFTYANCTNADFKQSIFVRANFTQASLTSSNFESSDLTASVLAGADLRGTRLSKALLHNVERQGTSLSMGGVIV